MRRRPIDPGRLRVFARLEAATRLPDGHGGFVEDWALVATVPISLEPLGATSTFSADQRRERATHRAVFRTRPDVTSGMRFTVGDRPMTIITIHEQDASGRYLVAVLEETGL